MPQPKGTQLASSVTCVHRWCHKPAIHSQPGAHGYFQASSSHVHSIFVQPSSHRVGCFPMRSQGANQGKHVSHVPALIMKMSSAPTGRVIPLSPPPSPLPHHSEDYERVKAAFFFSPRLRSINLSHIDQQLSTTCYNHPGTLQNPLNLGPYRTGISG